MKRTLVSHSLLLLAVFLALAPAALASAKWYVDGVNGSDNNNCKSRQHACKTISHAISIASSGDSIMIAAATYTENLTIGFSLKIVGSSAKTTIVDGGGIGTVFTIGAPYHPHVVLSKLTVRNGNNQGNGGGGIDNSGTLTINHSTITANTGSKGGGILNEGTLTISYSTITANSASRGSQGEGIYNNGILTVNHSTISGNGVPEAYGEGGGIMTYGILTISHSTITANSAYFGGGIGTFYGPITINNNTLSGNSAEEGGGMFNGGTMTLTNSTISGNKAVTNVGGGIESYGTLTINNSTVSGNSAAAGGGGIERSPYSGGPVTLQNSIIANNSGGNCLDTMTSNGYNLSSDNTCNFNGSGDLNNTDPKLGQLGNYGGPTQTLSLLSGSPAIDAGNPSGCTDGQGHLLKTDQRGKPRPDKEDTTGCDMGAYERQKD